MTDTQRVVFRVSPGDKVWLVAPPPGLGRCACCGHRSLIHGAMKCHYHAGDPGEETAKGGVCDCAGYVQSEPAP